MVDRLPPRLAVASGKARRLSGLRAAAAGFPRKYPQIDARDIARAVPMRQLLRAFGVCVRNSKRADCPLCKGNSNGTLAYTERLWRCHRCNEGGDVFTLVMAVNHCQFPDALAFVAGLAGVKLENSRGADLRRELAAHKERRQQTEAAAEQLEALEKTLRCECRDRIHEAERTQLKASERLASLNRGEPECFPGESESLWSTLQAAHLLLEIDLPTYSLLAFGAQAERVRYCLHPELRDEMVAAIRLAGGVHDDDGRWVEVLA
jgi:hypothetical protein